MYSDFLQLESRLLCRSNRGPGNRGGQDQFRSYTPAVGVDAAYPSCAPRTRAGWRPHPRTADLCSTGMSFALIYELCNVGKFDQPPLDDGVMPSRCQAGNFPWPQLPNAHLRNWTLLLRLPLGPSKTDGCPKSTARIFSDNGELPNGNLQDIPDTSSGCHYVSI